MSDILAAIAPELMGGGGIGFAMGYGLKKFYNILKLLIAALVGLQLALLAALETQGYISVDWMALNAAAERVISAGINSGVVGSILDGVSSVFGSLWAVLPISGGAAVGFFAGWRLG